MFYWFQSAQLVCQETFQASFRLENGQFCNRGLLRFMILVIQNALLAYEVWFPVAVLFRTFVFRDFHSFNLFVWQLLFWTLFWLRNIFRMFFLTIFLVNFQLAGYGIFHLALNREKLRVKLLWPAELYSVGISNGTSVISQGPFVLTLRICHQILFQEFHRLLTVFLCFMRDRGCVAGRFLGYDLNRL